MEHAADFGGCHHLTLVNRRLEASDMLHRHAVRFARLQVFVESGEDLIVEDLEFADSVDQSLDRDVGYSLVFAVDSLNAKDVVAGDKGLGRQAKIGVGEAEEDNT